MMSNVQETKAIWTEYRRPLGIHIWYTTDSVRPHALGHKETPQRDGPRVKV